jgi:TldD protein
MHKAIKRITDRVDYADLRVYNSENESILMENETLRTFAKTSGEMYGARVLKNGGWGLSFSNDPKKLDSLFEKAITLAKISSKNSEKVKITKVTDIKDGYKAPISENIFDMDSHKKLDFLKNGYKLAKISDRIKIVSNYLGFTNIKKEFYNSYGSEIVQEYPYTNLHSNVISREGDVIQSYRGRINKIGGFEILKDADALFIKTSGKSLKLLKAKVAPAGSFPMICDQEITGLFFHEAVGHACEADLVLNHESLLRNRLKKKIAKGIINLRDDGTIKGANGFFKYDDEGFKSAKTELITNGVLKGYLHSLETASRMDVQPTGNSRAASAAYTPIPRMSNIVLEKGDSSFGEMMKSIKKGIYAKGFGGGQVSPSEGRFMFSIQEAFLIEDGETKEHLRDVSISGSILETLKLISMVSDEPKLNEGGGFCGKGGQLVPVSEKVPHIKVDRCFIGGFD